MHGLFARKPEVPAVPDGDGPAGRAGKATNRLPVIMHAAGKSDGRVVPKKQPNKIGEVQPIAEAAEGRRPIEGNARQTTMSRTQRSLESN